MVDFVADLKAHGGDPADVRHVCMDMSAAYTEGVGMALPDAAISCARFHVLAMAIDAMYRVRRTEMLDTPECARCRTRQHGPQDVEEPDVGHAQEPFGLEHRAASRRPVRRLIRRPRVHVYNNAAAHQ